MLRILCGGAIIAALSLFVFAGCSGGGVKTHPVAGKVVLAAGDVAMLTGSTVELQHESDELLRPYGNLDSSGNFSVKTLFQGEMLSGAPEGKYKARIILADESDEGVPKRKGDPIHRRYYEFATSGLSVAVPAGDYTLTLGK